MSFNKQHFQSVFPIMGYDLRGKSDNLLQRTSLELEYYYKLDIETRSIMSMIPVM